MAPSFIDDPAFTYTLNSLPEHDRREFFPKFFRALVKAGILNAGRVDEVEDYGCCLVW